jgi:hypothetical protein
VTVVSRFVGKEAKQGVAVDARFSYQMRNNRIGKYVKNTGKRVAQWEGPRTLYPHMNSCVVDRTELICAASKYPAVPMSSAVEVFDHRWTFLVRLDAQFRSTGSWRFPKACWRALRR